MAHEAAGAAVPTVVFDTDVLVWFFRGNARARRFLGSISPPHRAISSLTLMELVQGCRSRDELRALRTFVGESISRLLHPDEATSHRAIALLEEHATAHGLRVVDALIAAAALASSSVLATGNVRHYRTIAGLELFHFRP